MNVCLRRAYPMDAGILSRISFSAKAYWGYPKRWMEIWEPHFTFLPEYFEENESWAAELNNTPIAFYTLQDKDGNAWLENLWVFPEYMRQGVGKQLFLHAVETACQRGYKTMQLEADPNAVGFYEKMGMCKIGERQSAIDNQPRVLPIMEMTL